MTSIGLLLGVSSAKLGTMDMSITRLLSIHIPALLPPTSTELDVPHNVQVIYLNVSVQWGKLLVVNCEIAVLLVIISEYRSNYTLHSHRKPPYGLYCLSHISVRMYNCLHTLRNTKLNNCSIFYVFCSAGCSCNWHWVGLPGNRAQA